MPGEISNSAAATRIDYIEIPMTDIGQAKRLHGDAFGWRFEDFGPEYAAFNCGNLNGGFMQVAAIQRGGALIVLFADNLTDMEQRILRAGGKISRAAFAFPGGRRFHFTDPSGNELAVWSDK